MINDSWLGWILDHTRSCSSMGCHVGIIHLFMINDQWLCCRWPCWMHWIDNRPHSYLNDHALFRHHALFVPFSYEPGCNLAQCPLCPLVHATPRHTHTLKGPPAHSLHCSTWPIPGPFAHTAHYQPWPLSLNLHFTFSNSIPPLYSPRSSLLVPVHAPWLDSCISIFILVSHAPLFYLIHPSLFTIHHHSPSIHYNTFYCIILYYIMPLDIIPCHITPCP